MVYFLFSYYYKKSCYDKASKDAEEQVEEVMHEMKKGELKTFTGNKVTTRKQAITIASSEVRNEENKYLKK
jgi:hypothetical protein